MNVYIAPENPSIEMIGSNNDVSLMKKYAHPVAIDSANTITSVPVDAVPNLFLRNCTNNETNAPIMIDDVMSIKLLCYFIIFFYIDFYSWMFFIYPACYISCL